MTTIQMETWDYCAEYHSYSGFGPTLHEVAKRFGLKSVASAQKRVNALIGMGFLRRLPGKKSRLEVLLVPDRGMKRLDEVLRMVGEGGSVRIDDRIVSAAGPFTAEDVLAVGWEVADV